MGFIFGLLLLLGCGAALDRAYQDLKADFRASRQNRAIARQKATGQSAAAERWGDRVRHAGAYWTREAGSGFPVIRTGFHRGWADHQAAQAQALARREEARMDALRKRAAFAKVIGDYRAERERLEAELAQAHRSPSGGEVPADGDTEPAYGPQLPACGTCGEPLRARAHDGKTHLDCHETAPKMSPAFAAMTEQNPALGEGFEDLRRLREDEGYEGPVGPDGSKTENEPGTDAARWVPAPQPASPISTTGGNMSEIGYRQSVATAQDHASAAETHAAAFEQMARSVENMADSMSADEMDSGTLADLMELAAKYRTASAAAQACFEGSSSFASALQQRHGGLAEAHENAPVDHAADRSFYETV